MSEARDAADDGERYGPLRGLPSRYSDVGATADSDVVYKAFSAPRSNTCFGATVSMGSMSDVLEKPSYHKGKASPPKLFVGPTVKRPVDLPSMRFANTHVSIEASLSDASRIIDNFLLTHLISTSRSNSGSDCMWKCHTLVKCSPVLFDIRLVDDLGSCVVEFRRRSGSTSPAFRDVFNCFLYHVSADPAKTLTKQVQQQMPLSVDFNHDASAESVVSTDDMNTAIDAMVSWLFFNPLEALQCVGGFYIAKNLAVVHSGKILRSICDIINEHSRQVSDNDCLIISLAFACLRQFLIVSEDLGGSCPELCSELVDVISSGLAKAAMSEDLTTRREAVALLFEMNPAFSSDIKRVINESQSFSPQNLINVV